MTEQSLRSNVVPAEKLLNRLNEMGIDVITEIDNEYPDKLKNSLGKDCPPVLFVGARRIAPYIDVDDDRSNSFKVLIEGLNKLV